MASPYFCKVDMDGNITAASIMTIGIDPKVGHMLRRTSEKHGVTSGGVALFVSKHFSRKYFFACLGSALYVGTEIMKTWERVSPEGMEVTLTPALVACAPEGFVVFVVNNKDHKVYYALGFVQVNDHREKLTMGEWRCHSGASTHSGVGAFAFGETIHLALRGTDNSIFYSTMWLRAPHEPVVHPWVLVPHGGATPDAPALTMVYGLEEPALVLAVRGMDDSLYTKTCLSQGKGAWEPWVKMPIKTSSAPAAGLGSMKDSHVLVRGTDNKLYHCLLKRDVFQVVDDLSQSPIAPLDNGNGGAPTAQPPCFFHPLVGL